MRLRLNRLGHELTLSGEQILRVVAYSDLRLKDPVPPQTTMFLR